MARETPQQRGPYTVAAALEAFPFRSHNEHGPRDGSGLILICTEAAPPANRTTEFRIIEGLSAPSNAGGRAGDLLRLWRNAGTGSHVFALIGEMPQATQDALMPRVQDAVSGERVFSIRLSD